MAIPLPEPLSHLFTPPEEPQTLDVVLGVLDKLEALPIETREELDAFLAAWSETVAWIGDHFARTRVAARRFTDDEAIQTQLANLIDEVMPEVSRRDDRLARKFLAAPDISELEHGLYAPFLRKVRTGVRLFRERNVDLQQTEEQLVQMYQRISGTWSVQFDGEARTMSAMHKYLCDPDREVRRAAWFGIADEIARTADEVEDLFEQLFTVRHQIALNADFDNYRDYVFAAKLRDYEPEACHNFAEVVREAVQPLVEELADDATRRLGIDSYAPWDIFAEPTGGAVLTPFDDTEQLETGVERMMRRLDPELGEQFAAIRDNLDLDSRPGKAQGGFMAWFPWSRRPFIFANASGKHGDIVTLLHEAGHAFHSLMSSNAGTKPMSFNMHPPMEFNEVASMAMELLHYETLDEFYDDDDAARAIQEHLRRVVRMFPRTIIGDQFQHWLYTHPEHSREQRRAKWVELHRTYAPHVDGSEVDDETLADSYHRILHFFVVPFYFIDYAFAQFGSLQVAMAAERDRVAALAAYKQALQLGPQRDVRGLYEAAGAAFDPTPETLGGAMDWVRERLDAELRSD